MTFVTLALWFGWSHGAKRLRLSSSRSGALRFDRKRLEKNRSSSVLRKPIGDRNQAKLKTGAAASPIAGNPPLPTFCKLLQKALVENNG